MCWQSERRKSTRELSIHNSRYVTPSNTHAKKNGGRFMPRCVETWSDDLNRVRSSSDPVMLSCHLQLQPLLLGTSSPVAQVRQRAHPRWCVASDEMEWVYWYDSWEKSTVILPWHLTQRRDSWTLLLVLCRLHVKLLVGCLGDRSCFLQGPSAQRRHPNTGRRKTNWAATK